MGIELPLITAIVARLPGEGVNLSALSTLVYPLSLIFEAPIIMLLAASTALCKDWQSYRMLSRFTHGASLILTVLHAALAFTSLFDWVAAELVNVHPDVLEPGRIGLQLTTPWTWAIAARRFQQGVLIRFERSRAVVEGTVVRLIAGALVLIVGFHWPGASGIVVGSLTLSVGVLAEALYAALRTRPLLRERFGEDAEPTADPLTWGGFWNFYLPLAVTPFMTIALQSIGAAAMNRMPEKLLSTGSWSAVYGLVFVLRSAGFAFNEVVVTLIDQPGGVRTLRRVAWWMGGLLTLVLVIVAATPLGRVWFADVLDLEPEFTTVAVHAVAFAVLMPGYAVLQSLYQGALVKSRRTRGVTEAVVLYFVVSAVLLGAGIWLGSIRGIVFALSAFSIAGILQTVWLWQRSRGVLTGLEKAAGDEAGEV